MASEYLPLPISPLDSDEDTKSLLRIPKPPRRTWPGYVVITMIFLAYTLGVCWVTKASLSLNAIAEPISSFPHPDEKEYVIQQTGHGNTPLHKLAFAEPSPEGDEGWYALLEPFNTRVPASRFEAMNLSSVHVNDGSGDYYVTLTMYHEIHCLMRIRWFLYPAYYENKTWDEQFRDPHIVGHFKHCIWSLLESVLCHGDTSIRTFHWDLHRPAPVAESAAERRCVNRDWLYRWTGERSFKVEERLLSHPVFGQLDGGLMPVNRSFHRS